jgi:hypothetical protein
LGWNFSYNFSPIPEIVFLLHQTSEHVNHGEGDVRLCTKIRIIFSWSEYDKKGLCNKTLKDTRDYVKDIILPAPLLKFGGVAKMFDFIWFLTDRGVLASSLAKMLLVPPPVHSET